MKNFKLLILIAFAAIYQPLWGTWETIDHAINTDDFYYLEQYIQDPETDLLATNEHNQTTLDLLKSRMIRVNYLLCYYKLSASYAYSPVDSKPNEDLEREHNKLIYRYTQIESLIQLIQKRINQKV